MIKNIPYWINTKTSAQKLLFAAALTSFLYFLGLWISFGAIYSFQWFWLALTIFFAAIGALLPKWNALFPKWFRVLWKVGMVLFLILFLIIESLIFFAGNEKPQQGADYVIVLGAKVNGTTPSLSLQYRIEAAYDYLVANQNTKVIASGGQGPNEGISEALAIRNTLMEMGIQEELIILEDQSTSTNENLSFSKKTLEQFESSAKNASVVLISSDFHIFRAKAIARNYGYENIEGSGAKSVFWLQPHSYVREFFAILNDFIKGNLK